jgi:hypothetical protein
MVKLRIATIDKGIAHDIKDLSNPLGLTLNQRDDKRFRKALSSP